MGATLQIYVSEKCWICEEARKITGAIRVEFPEVTVQFVTRESAVDWPKAIIATPAYVLDGRLTSLGNPDREHLTALLAEAVGRPGP